MEFINCDDYAKMEYDDNFLHIYIPLYNGQETKLMSYNISLNELAEHLTPYLQKKWRIDDAR